LRLQDGSLLIYQLEHEIEQELFEAPLNEGQTPIHTAEKQILRAAPSE
jgi:hypothetical protein